MKHHAFFLLANAISICIGLTFAFHLVQSNQQDGIGLWFKDASGSACTSPCLFGITPGKTKFEEGIQIISVHPVTKDMQRGKPNNVQNSAGFGNGKFCVLLWRAADDYVSSIVVSTKECYFTPIYTPQDITLGQVIRAIGNPSHITLGNYGVAPDYYFFFDGWMSFESWNEDNSCMLAPQAKYDKLEFANYDMRGSDAVVWRGFVNRSQYAITPADKQLQSSCHP